jgi:hypothetical protein
VPGLDPERRGELVPVPSSPSRVGQTDGFVRTAVPFMMRRDGGASWPRQRRLRRLPAGRGHGGGTCGCRAPGEPRENLPLISLPLLACTFPVRWFSLSLFRLSFLVRVNNSLKFDLFKLTSAFCRSFESGIGGYRTKSNCFCFCALSKTGFVIWPCMMRSWILALLRFACGAYTSTTDYRTRVFLHPTHTSITALHQLLFRARQSCYSKSIAGPHLHHLLRPCATRNNPSRFGQHHTYTTLCLFH